MSLLDNYLRYLRHICSTFLDNYRRLYYIYTYFSSPPLMSLLAVGNREINPLQSLDPSETPGPSFALGLEFLKQVASPNRKTMPYHTTPPHFKLETKQSLVHNKITLYFTELLIFLLKYFQHLPWLYQQPITPLFSCSPGTALCMYNILLPILKINCQKRDFSINPSTW